MAGVDGVPRHAAHAPQRRALSRTLALDLQVRARGPVAMPDKGHKAENVTSAVTPKAARP